MHAPMRCLQNASAYFAMAESDTSLRSLKASKTEFELSYFGSASEAQLVEHLALIWRDM